MIKFIPVLADKSTGRYQNNEYIPYILELFLKYKELLVDDYYPKDNLDLLLYLIDEINSLFPWFLVCLVDEAPIGVVWLSHWHGNDKEHHSCQLQAFMDKKYWGEVTKKAAIELFGMLFHNMGLKRIQMEIPEYNRLACSFAERMGFFLEGVIRNATLKNGKLINHYLYGLVAAQPLFMVHSS